MPEDGGWDCQACGRSKSIDPAAPAACCELGAGSMSPAWGEIELTASPFVAGAAAAACGAVEVSATAGGAASRLPQAARPRRSTGRIRIERFMPEAYHRPAGPGWSRALRQRSGDGAFCGL